MTASLLIVGRGRMGRVVEALAPDYGFQVAGTVDLDHAAQPDSWPQADVAIDFSLADAVPVNFPVLAARGMNVVIGATGWQAAEPALRAEADARRIGVVAAPNFAIGVNLFLALVERAAELWRDQPAFGAWLHELHHAAKKDAPSGTALAMESAMRGKGYRHPIDVSSSRAGSIPGTHTLGFDAAAETITLTHTARDRAVFARGALHAAQWLQGKRGWFTMKDVLGL
ncbi:MAG TPA: dihydrodipicolinate reductase C-terminal domain-containing protein [Vicinamibacterales bacterium]|nr:dihydrodipicolinate reductase C-terminal domain-containing protein [Vicinamibacterales bacterium]